VAAYNPTKDPDGSGAKLIIDLLEGMLKTRLEFMKSAEAPVGAGAPAAGTTVETAAHPASPVAPTPASVEEGSAAAVAPGEAWSSDVLEEPSEPTPAADESDDSATSETQG
jgi:hypothetical protein